VAASLLIVDDEPSIRKVLAAQLGRFGYEIFTAEDGETAVAMLAEHPVDVVITDLKMPGISGLELLAHVHELLPGTPVVLITAHGTIETAVEALKKGAFDYITKPFEQEELRAAVEKAVATARHRQRDLRGPPGPSDLVGESPAMRRVWSLIERVAPTPASVLITGEAGTGKELIARAVHALSDRRTAPFVQVSCGAIPEHLFEGELFGWEKGAFAGAAARKPGRVELSDGGTLFLDEVGDLPPAMQVRLLRALQDRTFDRVGGTLPVPVDLRVVAATDVDLTRLVREGKFREDLYYRLNVIPIHLAPLRERIEDLPALVAHAVARFNARLGTRIEGLTQAALDALSRHRWSGNLRELENLLERTMLLATSPWIDVPDLSGFRADHEDAPPDAREHDDLALKEYLGLHTTRLERHRIRRALEQEDGNVTRAARLLGISRRSLQTKMKDYGLREA
jgi:two-component system response regulator AtoC